MPTDGTFAEATVIMATMDIAYKLELQIDLEAKYSLKSEVAETSVSRFVTFT
jgi:hypothetical protein